MNGWPVLETQFFGNTLFTWLLAAGAVVASYFVLRMLLVFSIRQIRRVSKRTETDVDDFIGDLLQKRTKHLFLLVFCVFAGSRLLSLSADIDRALGAVTVGVLFIQVTFWVSGAIDYIIRKQALRKEGDDEISIGAYSVISWLTKAVLWSIVTLLILNNFGIEITALVAGLGVGGIAVALAVQNVLSDLFASLSIILDKPFEVGDFIIVGDHRGVVQHVGLKTTRVTSLSGEQIIFSNNDLLSSRISNYRRMNERRIVFSLGLIYQTPHEKLEKIPGIIREVIESMDKVRFDRAHFRDFGNFSLNFEVVYYVLDRDYNLYMDIQQVINLEIFRRFKSEGAEFAFPTQSIFLEKED